MSYVLTCEIPILKDINHSHSVKLLRIQTQVIKKTYLKSLIKYRNI